MARSSSAKNGKSSKNTYRASGSKSSKSSSSGARHNSSASGSKKRMSRLEQRRAQQQNLIRSVVLAGLGILAIALVLVPGQSFWNVLRSWLFGAFGVVTYFVGPFLLYLAYLLASGYHVGTFIGKVLLLAVLLAGTAVIFSDFKVGDTPWQTVKMLFAWGQRKFWTGGVLGVPIGASLLAVCGRPGANIVMIIVILMGLMVFFAVTPVDVVQFISYYIQEFKARRAARAEEETAYDTQLFGHEAEEESLENLTGSLPPIYSPAFFTNDGGMQTEAHPYFMPSSHISFICSQVAPWASRVWSTLARIDWISWFITVVSFHKKGTLYPHREDVLPLFCAWIVHRYALSYQKNHPL